MVSKAKKRLASAEGDPSSSPSSKFNNHTEAGQRRQPKRRTLQAQRSSLPASPQATNETGERDHDQQQSASPSSSNNPTTPSAAVHQAEVEHVEGRQDAGGQPSESEKIDQEREARERILDEFKQEYVDIVDQIPLDLNRKFGCMIELERSLEECRRELHEDLIAYMDYAKEVASGPSPEPTVVNATEEEEDVQDEMSSRLRTLAQPMLWGVVPIPPLASDGLPDHLKTLLVEISSKMSRLQDLSHDKLNLAESVYLALDRQLKRLDADLETYQDLEDQDAQIDRHHHETIHNNTVNDDADDDNDDDDDDDEPADAARKTGDQTERRHALAINNKVTFQETDRTARSQRMTPRQSPSRGASTPRAQVLRRPSADSAALSPPKSGRALRLNHSRPSLPTKSPVLAAHQTEESMSLAEEEGGSPRARKRTSRSASPGTPSAARVTRLSSAVLVPSTSAVETQDPASGPPGSQNTVSDQALYCSCQRISFGEMVACDNPDCQGGQWFHLECLGLAQLPAADDPSEWFCDRCRHDRQPATAPPPHVLENSSSRAAPKKKKKRTARR
ncbi:hypothetical protein PCASD_07748 [Puccinia coronata f. sp. avenae]|uniref:Chromatin modification-related protein n=1 Tax=Puccinia coronata f. sp. avenae TaxID=200324 RepID=A0A2N5UWY6_9BASI|nr:hypothetical protein PCASD_07748 [Puccinia coronata f. sp. avenae]